jgi:hypothetical protein
MLHAFFRWQQIADNRNHSDNVKNIAEDSACKKFTQKRKGNYFKIGENNVKIRVLFKTQ